MGTRKHRVGFIQGVAPHPKTQGGLKLRARTITYSDAVSAVEWLNATKGTAQYRRVLAVRQELEELGEMLNLLHQQRQEARAKGKGTPPSIEDMTEAVERAESYTRFRERHNALNRVLSRYAFEPVLAWDIDTGVWRCSTVPKDMRGRTIQVPVAGGTAQINEATVVAALSRLAASRALEKAHLCSWCRERWHVAEREIDKFCCAKCRESYHTHSPEYRQKKGETQRRYREQLKRHRLA